MTDTQSKKEAGDQSTAETEIITKRTGATLWKEHVEPLLKQNCFKCHGSAKKANDLDLRTLDSMVKGGERGSSVVAGKPNESLIYLYLQTGVEPHMPPGKQLSKEEIDLVKQWIKRIGDPALAKENPADNSSQPNAGANAEPQSPLLPTGVDPTLVIDLLIQKGWQDQKVQPSAISSDSTFVRRIYLDLIGRIPTTKERHDFETSTNSQKRELLIEKLLSSSFFGSHMAQQFNAMLMGRKGKQKTNQRNSSGWIGYLKRSFKQNKPWNQITKEVLLARPTDPKDRGAVWYLYERNNNYQEIAEAISPAFFGVQIQCAQCHNHPFDRWTMDDYYGFASFFSQIGRKTGEDYREIIIFNRGGGEVNHPVTKKPVPPTYLGGPRPETRGLDRRAVLAEWLTSPDNPYFATSIANRVWAHFMGPGIVEPVDDIRVSNPPSNPALFDELGRRFIEYEFDLKQLVRDICNSRAYQRSTNPNESNQLDSRNYAYAQVRRVPAEMLLDCISQATATKDKFRGLPQGARAVQIADGGTSTYFLNTFGRSPRNTVCDCEASTDPSLSQALHLLNGSSTQGKIAQGKLIQTWLDQELTVPDIVGRIFVRCLSRTPTDAEKNSLVKLVAESQDSRVGLEDVFWAVLNSREFMFNH